MYRILTERKDIDSIKRCGVGLGYTLVEGVGSWHGQAEDSLIIELNDVPMDLAEMAAHAIKRIDSRETVLLQEITLRCQLI